MKEVAPEICAILPLSQYFNKTVWKLHKIIQKRGATFERIPSNESRGVVETRWSRAPNILLNIVFPIDMFYGFSLLGKFHVLGCAVSQKQFLKEILGRKSGCYHDQRQISQTSTMEVLCEISEQLKTVIYCCKNLHRRCLAGF